MIDDPTDDISLNVQNELIRAERQSFVFQFTYNANLKPMRANNDIPLRVSLYYIDLIILYLLTFIPMSIMKY